MWITAGWVSVPVTAGLAVAAIVQVLDVVDRACIQPLAASGLTYSACAGAGTELLRGLVCAVLAGVVFFSGLACFFWAAHLRSMQRMQRIRQSGAEPRHRLFD